MDLKHVLRQVLKKKLLKKDLVHDYSFEKKKILNENLLKIKF